MTVLFKDRKRMPKNSEQFQAWKYERQITELRSELHECGVVLSRLSQEVIEEVLWLESKQPKTQSDVRSRISKLMGALRREKSLLTGLAALGFDLHPALTAQFISAAQRQIGESK